MSEQPQGTLERYHRLVGEGQFKANPSQEMAATVLDQLQQRLDRRTLTIRSAAKYTYVPILGELKLVADSKAHASRLAFETEKSGQRIRWMMVLYVTSTA